MSIKKKELVLKQIEGIFEEFEVLKSKFTPLNYPGAIAADQKEIAQINKIITKSLVLVSKYCGEASQYYKRAFKNSSRSGRKNLGLVIEDLRVFYENLKEDYESLEEQNTISLKYDKIILELNILDPIYEEVVAEINGTYNNHYFMSMYIIVRKFLENILYDCLKANYGTQDVKKYYETSKNQHQGYGILISNFNGMINDQNFKKMVGDVDQNFIDLLKEFQETGNENAHSLFNLAHQDFIEERRDKINILIKKLFWILQKI